MSFTEITLIMVVALILFGPEDLPAVARTIGKIVFQIRKFAEEITKELQDSINAPVPAVKPKDEKQNEDSEELLSYQQVFDADTAITVKQAKNPLEELPSDIIAYPDDKRAGE